MSAVPKRKILIVDDNEHDRAEIRRLLRNYPNGYEIREAEMGEEGLELCRAERPDCILLDFNLPDLNGNRFLQILNQEGLHGPPVPIAMLTGQEDDAVAAEALKRGAQDYLVKDGITGPGLVRAIENAIEKFNIARDLRKERAAVELRNRKLEVLRDELQEKVLELAEAQKVKDQFMAVMSHEMRTPLNAILGYAQLLDMGLDGELTAGQRAQIERIQVGSRHLLDLINDVLDLARADAHKLDLDVRPVHLGAVLEEVAGLLESQARKEGIALIVEPCEEGALHVRADLQRLRQILTNLIGNALKFTDEGSVTVRCIPADAQGMVRVAIRDTGIGIDPETLPMVFEDFYQAHGDLTRKYGGSGLGLAISQRLARLMDGAISAESELGEGSTFTLALPAAEEGSQLRSADVENHDVHMAAQSADRERQTSATVTVVAFGPNAETLAELKRQVHPGVHLHWTTDAGEVAELTRRENASLVVLDISTADGGAWSVAQAMHEIPELVHTPVLLLPAIPAASAREASEGLDLGWMSLVPKPFTQEQLTRAVTAAAHGFDREETDSVGADICNVLVVDDDPDSRRVAAKFLIQADVEVREAADGETALAEMRRSPPDVVVLDLMMPVLDGFGVLAAMRADPLLAGIPVVVLTAKSLSVAERQFLARTAVRVLQKGEHRLADVAALVLRAATRTLRAPG